jgi:hypothetical protein
MTFIVRVTASRGGTRGVIERARTGEKRPFRGVAAIGKVIATMVREVQSPARTGSQRWR